MRRQSGFSLSEILISLFLASIMMAILSQCYLNSKNQYMQAERILSERFDLQWVADLLSDSVRRAGFTPCMGIDQLHAIDRRQGLGAVSGLIIENQPKQRIQVNRMSEFFTPILSIQSPTQILVSQADTVNEKRPIVIADCHHAEVNNISSVEILPHSYRINLMKPLIFSYDASAHCGEWLEETWYIKTNAQGIDALYYKGSQTEELTPLIHTLRVRDKVIHGKHLLEIFLGLDEDKKQKLVVAVRGS